MNFAGIVYGIFMTLAEITKSFIVICAKITLVILGLAIIIGFGALKLLGIITKQLFELFHEKMNRL